MRIAALQMCSRLGDRAANQRRAAGLIAEAMSADMSGACAGRPDVLVLPEMWDLGYYPPNVLKLGDEDGASAREFLAVQAKKYAVNIVGGSIVRRKSGKADKAAMLDDCCNSQSGKADQACAGGVSGCDKQAGGAGVETGGKIWNTSYVFNRQGKLLASYDKTHLFSFAGEEQVFQPGENIAFYELDGVKAASVICYDLRFGELVRGLALSGAQLLFAPSAWGAGRLAHWRLLLKARAVENQIFVAGVNACGPPDNLQFCGHSMLVDPWGEVLAEAGDTDGVFCADCDLSAIFDVRDRINVYRDRRPGLYAKL